MKLLSELHRLSWLRLCICVFLFHFEVLCHVLLFISSYCVISPCCFLAVLTSLLFPHTCSASPAFAFLSFQCHQPLFLVPPAPHPHRCVCIYSVCSVLSLSVCLVLLCGPSKPFPVSSCYLIACSSVFAPCVLTNIYFAVGRALFSFSFVPFDIFMSLTCSQSLFFVQCFCIWVLNFIFYLNCNIIWLNTCHNISMATHYAQEYSN